MNQGHERDFLTVGSMGHTSQIALGIAMAKPNRKVWCFDGDGAAIMHLGSLAIVANNAPKNYVHIVFNNGAHDSVGGQPTVGLKIDLPAVAKAVGYKTTISVSTIELLKAEISKLNSLDGPILFEVRVRKGNRKELGRPTITPIQIKESFMQFLKN
jgi:phosphonopyruvate decarboxylase